MAKSDHKIKESIFCFSFLCQIGSQKEASLQKEKQKSIPAIVAHRLSGEVVSNHKLVSSDGASPDITYIVIITVGQMY